MGLFDDDFYSTKVSRRAHRSSERASQWSRPRKSFKLSTLQVSLISSALSAIVAVVIFSWIIGPFSSSEQANPTNPSTQVGSSDPNERLVQAAAKVSPAVVSILNHRLFSEVLDDSALGSGVIFKKENGKAFIITNYHVIEGASELEVMTMDGKYHKATVQGEDRITDIAVLEIDDLGINTIAEIGDSTNVRLGEKVFAIGNPLGFDNTVTDGIISYTSRLIPVSINQDGVYDWEQEVIQTSAAINEGNSGGALVDLNGKVIGINTMKISDTGVEGLGFAIPMNQVMSIVEDLMIDGKVSRPYLGVYTLDIDNPYSPISNDQWEVLNLPDEVAYGVIVLEAHGPAEQAGLKLNDVITAFDGQPIGSTLELRKFLYENKKIGEKMEVTFYRDGKQKVVNVTLEDKPSLDLDLDLDTDTDMNNDNEMSDE